MCSCQTMGENMMELTPSLFWTSEEFRIACRVGKNDWAAIKRHPKFPKPAQFGGGGKDRFLIEDCIEFARVLAREGMPTRLKSALHPRPGTQARRQRNTEHSTTTHHGEPLATITQTSPPKPRLRGRPRLHPVGR